MVGRHWFYITVAYKESLNMIAGLRGVKQTESKRTSAGLRRSSFRYGGGLSL